MNKVVPWVLFGVTAVGFAVYAFVQNNNGTGAGGAAVGNEAVAKVGNETITAQELYDQMVKQGGAQVVDSMIEQRLIKNEAKKENITVTDEDLNDALGKIKKNFPSDEIFNQQLAAAGLTEEQLKQELVTEVELTKLLEPQIKITDEDIKKYYEDNKESFSTPEQVRASHILVDTKEEAEEILKQLKEGADFAKLAKEKSKDTVSAANGGDLDYFGKGQMMPEFEKAAFDTPLGQLSDIVKTTYGYHIIKVTDKKPAHTATLEEKKEEIRETLFEQQKSQKAQPYIEELKGKTKTENYLEKA
ncbi:peptidylprolyl isomerase [Paenibacillus thermotolerans]|uniref:peptidylprolyl isomerase n=1 Tax=Paenibacillus thermotolerans TaxID=3027807 RepID=UPI0023683E24|nr:MULTISPECIES: peptidylprolyl isomerase [unclassified Paenibacillus]